MTKIIPATTVETCGTCPFQEWPESSMHPHCTHYTFTDADTRGTEILPPADDADLGAALDTIPAWCPLEDAPRKGKTQ